MTTILPVRWNRTRPSRASRGFTLVELLVVVAMIGVLAALALVGYGKYIKSAQSSEGIAMLQNIRVAQETYKAEALTYFNVSTALDGASLYPRTQTELVAQGGTKATWTYPHADAALWQQLNVRSDGPVRFSYATMAGLPGGALPSADVATMPAPNWANGFSGAVVSDPWFVASAVADKDADGRFAVLQTGSMTNEVFVQDDDE